MDYINDNSSTVCSVDTYYESDPSPYERSICSERSKQSEKSHENHRLKDENRSSMFTINRKNKGKNKKINIFNTSTMINTPIVNAVTGFVFTNDNMMSYRVGSMDELLFFKVRFLSGECGVPAITLFYDTPEQYENQMNVTLSQTNKSSYVEKRNEYVSKMRIKELQKKKKRSTVTIH